MCGITGWADFRRPLWNEAETVSKMTNSLARRGPDDSNMYIKEHVIFGHKRLVVVDPEGGKQPMTKKFHDHAFTICYNGELYNTEDIRKELLKRGHHFNGHSDTEVLLHSYIEWKEDCLQHLNGIFAFAVWDDELEKLFIARDRLGVKPLFYSIVSDGIIFGSEIKALLAHPDLKAEIGLDGLAEIFALGPSRTPGHGVFKNIHELRPAHALNFSREGVKIWRYWQVKSSKHTDTLEDTTEKVRDLVTDAIVRQLVSDVPVCTFLSGGVDSSAITAIAAHHFRETGKGSLHTYSIDYEDNNTYFQANEFQPNSDQMYINLMSNQFNTIHHSCVITNEKLAEYLTEAVIVRDLPGMADIDSSLLWFCQEIKKDFVVSLSGECADEIFGGYPWFHRTHELSSSSFPWMRSIEARNELLRDPWRKKLNIHDYIQSRYEETVKETPLLEGENEEEKQRRQLFYLNMIWFMTTLLDRKDRMSMGASLEVRVPFADHRLVEYVWNIPWEMKTKGNQEKGILRHALEGILPHDILYRKKSPYPKTHHPAYTKAVTSWLESLLQDKGSPLHEFLDHKLLNDIVKTGGEQFSAPWFGQLMTGPQLVAHLAQIHVWFKHYHINVVE